jgi:ABC-type polysaccharide/polyol phosphate transport system, ATPase component
VQVMTQGNHTLGVARRNQIFVYVLLMVLVSVLIGLIRLKRQIAKANRHKKSKRKLDKDIQLSEWEEEKALNHTARTKKVRTKKAVREDKVVIDVNHVVMDFKREKDEATSIKEHVIRTLKRQHSYEMFRALDDISFQVKSGEVVGIIGTNGSGKSTILKIISGVLTPTSGSVHVDTSKIQLLTLGTGFDMELTGHENVYLNGALIGYTKEYIDKKYDEIVAFAELEGFMEEKVRNYSSGMVSRLGFAIATIRDTPEILILDEVLSVGDMFFKKKSIKRIEEMIHGGSTVLIVSHSPSTIREHCTKAVWIEKSKLRAVGVAKDVCNAYEKMTPIGK